MTLSAAAIECRRNAEHHSQAILVSGISKLVGAPVVDADASGLLALKQKFPQVKDVLIDLDSAKIIKADTTIESVPIKTVVIGDAYVERTKSTKPQTLVCVIGDKGKVLLTLFSDK